MPDTTTFSGVLTCPACGVVQTGRFRFQWGKLPLHRIYAVGDEIEWLKDHRGLVVPPFVLVECSPEPNNRKWNFGTPSVSRAILLNTDNIWTECPGCKSRLMPAAEVEAGAFKMLRGLTEGDLEALRGPVEGEVDTFLVHPDGTVEPMMDWHDHTVTYDPTIRTST